jgi:hypothetical protein
MKQPSSPDTELKEQDAWFAGWNRFWFQAVDPTGLHMLRVLTGLLLLAWVLPFATTHYDFFSLGGWFDRTALQEVADLQEGRLPLGWSLFYLVGADPTLVSVIYWLSVVVLVLFTLGLAVRVTAVLAWVVVMTFLSNPVIGYDADYLLVIPTFYLMIGYVFYGQMGRPTTPLERVLGPREASIFNWFSRTRREEAPSSAANLAVRLFQIHFALIVVVSCLHKLQKREWWGGVAFFFPMHPPYGTTIEEVRALRPSLSSYLFFMSLATYLTLAWQLAFPTFAWRKNCRWLLIGGGILGWIGSAFIFKLPLFGPFYLIGCLNYLSPEEWRSMGRWIWSVLPGTSTEEPPPSKPIRLVKEPARGEKEVRRV